MVYALFIIGLLTAFSIAPWFKGKIDAPRYALLRKVCYIAGTAFVIAAFVAAFF